jgi:PH domain
MSGKMEELFSLAPGQLKSVRLGGTLMKRSGAVMHPWHKRYVVLSGNFLFLYNEETDSKPKKVVCVDGCSVVVSVSSFVCRR